MRILIAEDDPITLKSINACLRGEGFTTLLAEDGQQAIDIWCRSKPDFVCLDIMMPEVDGYEVCRHIRAVDKQLPILFLSAKNEEIDVVVGLELGPMTSSASLLANTSYWRASDRFYVASKR